MSWDHSTARLPTNTATNVPSMAHFATSTRRNSDHCPMQPARRKEKNRREVRIKLRLLSIIASALRGRGGGRIELRPRLQAMATILDGPFSNVSETSTISPSRARWSVSNCFSRVTLTLAPRYRPARWAPEGPTEWLHAAAHTSPRSPAELVAPIPGVGRIRHPCFANLSGSRPLLDPADC